VHATFLLLVGWVAFGHWQESRSIEATLAGVGFVLAIFGCVVLHELGHALTARRFGVRTRDIVLLPIGGVARAERIPENPRQEIVVAVFGPLVNFALAAVFALVLLARGWPVDFENDFLFNLLAINLALGTFNLIPAFPMDGGRILRGALATRMDYLSATRFAKNVGQIIAILFVLVGFMDSHFIMLPLIAVFVFFGAITEERMVRLRLNADR
jgi:Zn-dependent protease